MTQTPVPKLTLRQKLDRFLDSDFVHSFKSTPTAVVSALVSLVLILAAIFAPWITPQNPFNPASLNLMDGLTAPMQPGMGSNRVFWLGADEQGRDVFSALLYGSRISLFVGFASTVFSAAVGVSLGLLAGYFGGKVDALIMRVADVQLSFPAILVALLVFGVARGLIPAQQQEQVSLWVMVVALGLANWAQYARTVRASTLVERQKDYVSAARIIGRAPGPIMGRHVLPNVAGPVLVIATINLALAILEEATLSFLGAGLPVTQPSLGTLIRFGQQQLFSGEWWILVFPAAMLVALALSINLLGDWLRDALDPKIK
ncbi:MAG TPA: ABC transporter permease [Beijerinckiaceae bacterium]|nr:ABC transporter permease [Beijerinckiaceae bacterium]